LCGHGVDPALESRLLAATEQFFALDPACKRALSIDRSPHFRGYTRLGAELTGGRADWREQLDLGADEAAGQPYPGAPAWHRLRGPNPWPDRVPALRPIVLEWMRAMDSVALAVLRALARGLGQPADYFDRFMLPRGDPHLKLIRYPPAPAGDAGQGVGMHHDSGLLSFILQDGVGGLEVELDDGIVLAEPRPGRYVMNLGEMLQAATDGYLRATRHRVTSPAGSRARLSAAYFAHPKLESVFLPIALPPELAAGARGGQNSNRDDPIHACFGDNYLKIRLRAHPDVAAAHYADLLGAGG
jgi:isopenicillin N synthase-like dioxygenase